MGKMKIPSVCVWGGTTYSTNDVGVRIPTIISYQHEAINNI